MKSSRIVTAIVAAVLISVLALGMLGMLVTECMHGGVCFVQQQVDKAYGHRLSGHMRACFFLIIHV